MPRARVEQDENELASFIKLHALMNVRREMPKANWLGQRGEYRAVASKTDGYVGMQLTFVSTHTVSIAANQPHVLQK